MAFKKLPPKADIPTSPDQLFLELPRRKIPSVLPHQRDVMRAYADQAIDVSDVALQLPTGSGKTLVGLLIAEWLQRKNHERIVYLCPTRHLVNQVVEQAEDKYGLTVLGFTGRRRNYDARAKAAYRNADHIAVTTYSSLFNTNSFFSDADVLILDDAHAAENYIAQHWSLCIERSNAAHANLYTALLGVLRPHILRTHLARLSGQVGSLDEWTWVDKLPTPTLFLIKDEITEILDTHTAGTSLEYSWSVLREHLHACHLYLSAQELLIRPLIAPTWTHPPFATPRQRIYMSATLGAGGDLERLMGRRSITRLPVPEGWDRQGVGRRFFIFPGMSLEEQESEKLRIDLIRRAGRSLVLVPSDRLRDELAADIRGHLGYRIFLPEDIERSTRAFLAAPNAVAIMANRYDGIDFPGDTCRLLLIEGLPKATNLQERFLMSRMGANVLFNERVQTRVLQAIGRCTRSLEDYSAVVVLGEELQSYLADKRLRKYLHPELQAELEFGVEQSKDVSADDIVENFRIFYENGAEWEAVNQEIVATRKTAKQEAFPAIDDLTRAVRREILFQEKLWQADFEEALAEAEGVLATLDAPELRGYRALWEYLAGSAAWIGRSAGVARLKSKAVTHFTKAKKLATGISWLVDILRIEGLAEQDDVVGEDLALLKQLDRVEILLAKLGTVHERDFARREKEILDGIQSTDRFEQAQKLLGELLGFDADKVEDDGSPDPWWVIGDICIVFEDYVDAQEGTALSVTKARQAASHPNWIRENVPSCKEGVEILPVLVTAVNKVKIGARPHTVAFSLWNVEEFRGWALNAVHVVRELRKSFIEPGDLVWRAEAAQMFEENVMDARGLYRLLRERPAADVMAMVK